MPKKKSTYEMAEEVKGHPVVVRMQKDDINDTELIAIMDEYLHTPTPMAMRTFCIVYPPHGLAAAPLLWFTKRRVESSDPLFALMSPLNILSLSATRFKKVAKTKDAAKKKAIKELKKANPGKESAEIMAMYKEADGKADQDYVTEAEFVTAFTKGIKARVWERV